MLQIGFEFIKNSGNVSLRSQTMEAGRSTLMAVAKLLIMADLVDVHLLLNQVEKV